MPRHLILASSNAKKISELNAVLGEFGLIAISQQTLGVGDAKETGLSFIENALLKARHAAQATGQAAIADDSGLCVPALGGQPGIYSARYSGEHGNDAANNHQLLTALGEQTQRHAYYVCTIAYVHHPDDPLPILAQGLWHGEILREPRGNNGFGYDPLFWLPAHGKTAAELAPEEKNRLSHRALALADFVRQYRERYPA
ncbi:MAG: RdgB/HAM1 family non-canonical purine NTP pyrophosphatase [Cardiobacteriaceae bacterium]|nr:RdgB/HAM1 family non-canonical purine NTP pyrophosphatase [Cardiobacteriaceae bacterium]